MVATKTYTDLLRAFHKKPRVIAMKGSARSGKSTALIQFADQIMDWSGAHQKLSIVSQSFPHLKDGVIYEYKKHMIRDNFQRIHNKADHEFQVNKSIINYFSLDGDGSKAIGPGRDYLWVNEPNKGVTFDNYNNLMTRTGKTIFLDYNPSGEFWLHTEGILDDPDTILITSTWLDNIANLTPGQIQTFINNKRKSKKFPYWDYWWKVYGLGEDAVLLDERIMPFLKRCSKIPDNAVEIPSALDFGFYPAPTAFCRLFVVRGELMDDLYIQPLVYDTRMSINAKAEDSKNLTDLLIAKGHNKNHLIIAESAEGRSLHDMRAAEFTIEAVHKTSVEASIPLFHDYNIYIVDTELGDKCYREMDNYKYKRNRKGVILGVPEEGQADHFIDGIRYVLLSRNKRWSLQA